MKKALIIIGLLCCSTSLFAQKLRAGYMGKRNALGAGVSYVFSFSDPIYIGLRPTLNYQLAVAPGFSIGLEATKLTWGKNNEDFSKATQFFYGDGRRFKGIKETSITGDLIFYRRKRSAHAPVGRHWGIGVKHTTVQFEHLEIRRTPYVLGTPTEIISIETIDRTSSMATFGIFVGQNSVIGKNLLFTYRFNLDVFTLELDGEYRSADDEVKNIYQLNLGSDFGLSYMF